MKIYLDYYDDYATDGGNGNAGAGTKFSVILFILITEFLLIINYIILGILVGKDLIKDVPGELFIYWYTILSIY